MFIYVYLDESRIDKNTETEQNIEKLLSSTKSSYFLICNNLYFAVSRQVSVYALIYDWSKY